MMRQLIIARKDLNMSPGKLAAQVSHASMAFLSTAVKFGSISGEIHGDCHIIETVVRKDVYEDWINGSFTKTICEAKNKNQLMKAVAMAEDLDLEEGIDFFLIRDNCLTELTPEEIDENGVGRTLTCIGFRPLPDEIAHQISRKYQLYK